MSERIFIPFNWGQLPAATTVARGLIQAGYRTIVVRIHTVDECPETGDLMRTPCGFAVISDAKVRRPMSEADLDRLAKTASSMLV